MGYRVKEVREKVGMTQEELSARSGVSRATICALENQEERNTTSRTLNRLAVALGVSVDQLFFAANV